ncbi:hypothetical protein AB0J51_19470 [Micromonospora echinofusca]|uniref:hypothetical protein n=1 Tax=Micromonospora echinofusca TaxID=47858 RepID=UPI00342BB688
MRKWWVLAFSLLFVAVSGVFFVSRVSAPAPSGRELPTPLRDHLAARVVEALEHDPTFRTEVTREPGTQPVCVASVFGVAPDWAATGDEARTIYSWVKCSWVSPADFAKGPANLDISQLSGLSMPVSLHLGPPVTYQAPADGGEYADSIRRIFPKPLEAAASSHPVPSLSHALQKRILHVVGSPPSPPSSTPS